MSQCTFLEEASSSSGITGSGWWLRSTPSPVGVERQHEVLACPTPRSARGSRRGCARRATPRARAPPWRCTRETSSMLRRSIARCQPGLYCRCPSTEQVLGPLLELLDLVERLLQLLGRADDADQVVHRLWRSCWIVYGFSPPSLEPSNGASACSCGRLHVVLGDRRARARRARRRTPRPRRRPACRTPAGRTASCRRAGWSRACRRSTRRRRTGRSTTLSSVSGSTSTPPIT